MSGQYTIGYDVGTGGCKAVLVTAEGTIAAKEFEPYEVCLPREHCAEQDPEDWWRAVAATTRRLLENTGTPPDEVVGIGFATQMLGVLPVDEKGEPLSPGIIWMDSRAQTQADRIVRKLGGRRLLMALLGVVPSGKDVLCKYKWFEEEEPHVYECTRYFLDVKGYIVYRATGRFETDQTAASVTGYMDNRTRDWSKLTAGVLGGKLEKLPPVKRCFDVAGGLTERAAADLGLKAGTPVASGMGDAPAAMIGAGALRHGESVVSIGTSGLLLINSEKRVKLGKNGMASIAAADPEMWLVTGEMITTGSCLKWFIDELVSDAEKETGGDIYAKLNEAVESVPAGSRKLVFTPWMYGERAPVTDTTLRGGFVNLGIDHTRDDMLRALFEGVALNFRWGFEAAAAKGLSCDTVRAIGGGALSDTWMQIFADVTGRVFEPIEGAQEAGALGAALNAAVAVGTFEDYDAAREVVRTRATFKPDSANREIYDRLFEHFKRFYGGLSPVYRTLNA